MKKWLPFAIVFALAWGLGTRHRSTVQIQESTATDSQPAYSESHPAQRFLPESPPAATHTSYSCDGRTYCSQMHSCDEARYFLQNCADVKMDGDHGGIPCEQQWCPN